GYPRQNARSPVASMAATLGRTARACERGPAARPVASLSRRCASALGRRGAGVAERLVTLAHRLAEARLGRPLLERVALGGVAGDPVEHGAEQLRRVQALAEQALVDEQLHHLQL